MRKVLLVGVVVGALLIVPTQAIGKTVHIGINPTHTAAESAPSCRCIARVRVAGDGFRQTYRASRQHIQLTAHLPGEQRFDVLLHGHHRASVINHTDSRLSVTFIRR